MVYKEEQDVHYGAAQWQKPPVEGAAEGVRVDPWTGAPIKFEDAKGGLRSSFGVRRNFSFLYAVKMWRINEPPVANSIHVSQSSHQEPEAQLEANRALLHRVYASLPQEWIDALQKIAPNELRRNPNASMVHGARHFEQAMTVLEIAAVRLARGEPVGERIWRELGLHGGPLCPVVWGDPPAAKARRYNVEWRSAIHAVALGNSEPGAIIIAAGRAMVASFLLMLALVQEGATYRLRECAEEKCGVLFVASGRVRYCLAHASSSKAARNEADKLRETERKRDWDATRGRWPSREGLLRRWHKETDDRVRIIRFAGMKFARGITPATCSYSLYKKTWAKTV